MRGQTVTVFVGNATFVTEECFSCGILFAMEEQYRTQRLKDKSTWYCPNGHSQHYLGKSDAALRKEAEEAQRLAETRLSQERTRHEATRDQLKATRGSLSATKGVLTKERKRTRNGVCTECHRTFPNLASHMASKHPGAVNAANGEKA
jgi:hypothetical protein